MPANSDELPKYLKEIGRKSGFTVTHAFGELPDKEAKYLSRIFDKAIKESRWFDPKMEKTYMPAGLELKRYLMETRNLNKKVQT